MNKLVGLLCILYSLNFTAFALHGELRNFNLNYNHPSGEASTQYFVFQEINYQNPTQFLVELQAGSIFLETPESTIQIDNLPRFVADVAELQIQNANILSDQQNFSFHIEQFFSKANQSDMTIQNLNISCAKLSNVEPPLSELLNSCLNNRGEIFLGSFYEGSKKQIADFTMNSQNGIMAFKITAEGKTIRGEGETYFDQNIIRIKITKAKYGIFNVRGRLFRELEILASEKISINNPWIEIEL